MDIKRILNIGMGGCGNTIIDELLSRDKRYVGLFVNSAFGDFEDLKNFDIDKNAFLFSGTDGTGRNQDVALEILRDQVQSLVDTVLRYQFQDVINIYISMDGGTGAGIAPSFTKALRRFVNDKKKINMICIAPNINKADKTSLQNTIKCWNSISELINTKIICKDKVERNVLNDIKIIDNSKRKSYTEINKELINMIFESHNMNGKCEYGSIDDKDAKIFNNAEGYGIILSLDGKYTDTNKAIDLAIQDSIFAIPSSFKCDYLGISITDFDGMDIKQNFEVNTTTYYATNKNKRNTLVLGGCSEPTDLIETIQTAYELILEKEKTSNNKTKTTIIDINIPKNKTNEPKSSMVKTEYTSEEMDDLLKDLF